MKETVLVICAHSDDQIFGCGGTMAKYASEGKSIHTIIFSFGESSHPWIQSRITAETRVKESQEADKLIGGKSVTFLGLKESRLTKEIAERNIVGHIKGLIRELKPSVIFTHSASDPHPNHRTVLSTVLSAVDASRWKGDVYSFDIWNPLKIRGRISPRLVVDISETFGRKLKALQLFRSQKVSFYMLAPSVFIGAVANGLAHGVRYAEVFLKVR